LFQKAIVLHQTVIAPNISQALIACLLVIIVDQASEGSLLVVSFINFHINSEKLIIVFLNQFTGQSAQTGNPSGFFAAVNHIKHRGLKLK